MNRQMLPLFDFKQELLTSSSAVRSVSVDVRVDKPWHAKPVLIYFKLQRCSKCLKRALLLLELRLSGNHRQRQKMLLHERVV